ncbi:MAG: hypothetical protein GX202_02420 [Firmicutes bacterium]|nr:hypothetical protein [Bacillota bacterium]
MTDSLFFDNDCLAAFLWVQREDLLLKLYPGKIVVPQPVYDELSYPGIAILKARIDYLIFNGQVHVEPINVGSDAYSLYYQLTVQPQGVQPIIGKGEAASIALAKLNKGIVASNNLKDISFYINKFHLKHITTGDILLEALVKGFITEVEGNKIWALMLAKRRKLGSRSFTDYIKEKQKQNAK